MLRHVVGDSTFFEALRAYYGSEHQYSHANTADLQAIFENVSGMDLAYFFDQWIYGTFFPRYNWSYMSEPNSVTGGFNTYLYLWQTQASSPDVFAMPIDLVFTYAGGVDTVVQINDVKDTIYIYHTDEQPIDIDLDPDDWILKQRTEATWGYHLIPFPLDSAGQYENYLDSVVAKGGSGDNRYFLNSGTLPNGLTLDSLTGHIGGMPSEFGDFVFTVLAEDNGGAFMDLADYYLRVTESPALAGDANGDGTVNLLDITYIIDYIYNDGPDPILMEQADPDQSCFINILDITYLINYLYRGGPDPLWGCAK
jgi:CubicO group peptidase (beta-lactamase class C family)